MRFWLLLLLLAVRSWSAQIVGTEARLNVPLDGLWYGTVNVTPGEGAVVVENPPTFSWFYATNQTSQYLEYPGNYGKDILKEFTFQVATNSDMSTNHLVVNLRTRFNFYAALAPFTNANGSTYTGTLYWHVGFSRVTNLTEVYWWSPIHTFSITNTPVTTVDRSLLASDSFTNLGHPRMWFTEATRTNFFHYFATNGDDSYYGISNSWVDVFASASNTVSAASWGGDYRLVAALNSQLDSPLVDITTNINIWQVPASPALDPGTNRTIYKRVIYWTEYNGLQGGTVDTTETLPRTATNVTFTWTNLVGYPSAQCILFDTDAHSDAMVLVSQWEFTTNLTHDMAVDLHKTNLYYQVSYLNSTGGVVSVGSTERISEVTNGYILGWGTSPDANAAARALAAIGLMHQRDLTNAFWTNGISAEIERWAIWYRQTRQVITDTEGREDYYLGIGSAYDWCFDLLTERAKSNVLYAIEEKLHAGNYFGYPNETTNIDLDIGDQNLGFGTPAYAYESHAIGGDGVHLYPALAMMTESPIALQYARWRMNWNMAKFFGFGSDAGYVTGRGYDQEYIRAQRITEIMSAMLAAWPQWTGTNNIKLRNFARWADRHFPVGFRDLINPWGQTGAGRYQMWDSMGYAFSRLTQDPEIALHDYNNTVEAGASNYRWSMWQLCKAAALPPPPTGVTNSVLSGISPREGWVDMASVPPNSAQAHSNGVFVTAWAPPAGGVANHSFGGIGCYQMTAYGADLTMGGETGMREYGFNPAANHATLMIEGAGPYNQKWPPHIEHKAFISAFTNGSGFTYAALDLTDAYARTNNPKDLALINPSGYFTNAQGEQIQVGYTNIFVSQGYHHDLTNVVRHLLFVRNKYLVVHDRIGATNEMRTALPHYNNSTDMVLDTTNATWNWTVTNWYQGGTFTNAVRVFMKYLNAAQLQVTNFTGTNTKINPITGYNPLMNEWQNADLVGTFPRTNSVWVMNKNKATNFTFTSILYPVKPGDPDPTIVEIDPYTVAVTNSSEGDVISFNRDSAVATLIVDVGATNAPPTPRVAQPVFSPAGPAVDVLPTNVIITCSTPGATIWWTTNGTTPYAGGNGYDTNGSGIAVGYGMTLKAMAEMTLSNWLDSYVTSVTFTTNGPVTPTVGNITITPNGGTFTNSVTVSMSCATNGAAIYYTTNGSAPSTNSTLYTAPFDLTNTSTVKAVGVLSGYSNSAVATATFTAVSPELPTVGTPVITPPGTSFLNETNFILSCSTNGATILYSVDGSTPSVTYTGAVTVTQTLDVRAKATLAGHNDSAEATATFTRTNAPAGSSSTRNWRVRQVITRNVIVIPR
jgi:hypothetical protein